MDLHLTRPGILSPVHVDPMGVHGPTPGQARGPRRTRVGPSLYRPTLDIVTTQQRIVDAAACVPDGCAVTGWAALRWLGARWFDGQAADGSSIPVPIAVGDRHAKRKQDDIVLSEDWLFPGDVTVVDGLPVTVPVRSVTYEARVADGEIAALRAIEMAAYDDLVSLAELRSYTATLTSRPGKVQLEAALAVADENAWSPMEIVMRRFWQRDRDRALVCNQPVFDLAGNHLFTPDLLDVEAGVAGEYDGSVHDTGPRRGKDLDRHELARRLGIEVATMMAGQGERQRFLRRLDGAYERAARFAGQRHWSIEPPGWWTDTTTVARRRALSPAERERWLGHRRTGHPGREIA